MRPETRTIRLLHIGDVHLPDCQATLECDIKDPGFPQHLSTAVAPNRLQTVVRKLADKVRTADGVAICGDLTSRGDLEGYKQCVKYLAEALTLSRISRDKIHVVPGNHDVDRGVAQESTELLEKFRPLGASWNACHISIFKLEGLRKTLLSNAAGNSVQLFSINSCIGCGELRSYPEPIKTVLEQLLQEHINSSGRHKNFDILGETLDTPAFLEEDLQELASHLEASKTTDVALLLTHHNLLPQMLTQVALYGHLLNSGAARRQLSGANPTILYLHGHTHNGEVEVVTDPQNINSPIFSISAPLLSDGFNAIDIEYSKSGYPLGCIVTKYLMKSDGLVKQRDRVRLPLQGDASREALSILGEDTLALVRNIPTNFRRFKDVLGLARDQVGRQIRPATLAETLRDCEWLALVEILDREAEPERWQVRRINE